MKIKYTITSLVLSSDSINVSYNMMDDMVTGRVSIPFDEFSEEMLKAAVLEDIEARKESILAMADIVKKWKGQNVEVELQECK